MYRFSSRWLLLLISLIVYAGCDELTDAATRLASDIQAGASSLGREEGAKYSIQQTSANAKECSGPYKV